MSVQLWALVWSRELSGLSTTIEPNAVAPRAFVRTWSREAVSWAVILLSPVPLLMLHFRRLWLFQHYHYFPFVIAAFAYFTWRRWPEGDRSNRVRMPKTETTLVVIGFVLLTISTFAWSPWFAAMAAIFTVGAALVHFAGRHAVAQLSSVWLLLWFLMPIPLNLDLQLIFELQTIASNASSYLLDFFGVNHFLAGHVLEVPHHKFLVEEACSGIHSLFALLAFAAILLIALRRSWIHSAVLLVAAIFWATSINIIRVTTVVVAFAWFGVDLATAWKHELLGLALYGFAILLLFCTDQLILFFFERPSHVGEEDYFLPDFFDEDATERVKLAGHDNAVRTDIKTTTDQYAAGFTGAVVLGGLFAVLGAAQFLALGLKIDAWRVAGEASERLDGAFQATILPQRLGEWEQASFESQSREMANNLGARFSAWNYRTKDAAALVHVNYPFLGWHHLPECFQAQGWQIKSLEMIQPAPLVEPGVEVWQLELVQPSETMHVWFCQFDAHGNPVRPAAGWNLTSWRKILLHRPAGRWPFLTSNASSYQVVMQVTSANRGADVSPEKLTADFLTIRARILETVLGRLHEDD